MNGFQALAMTIALSAGLCAVLGAAEWVGTRILDALEERAARKHRRYIAEYYKGKTSWADSRNHFR